MPVASLESHSAGFWPCDLPLQSRNRRHQQLSHPGVGGIIFVTRAPVNANAESRQGNGQLTIPQSMARGESPRLREMARRNDKVRLRDDVADARVVGHRKLRIASNPQHRARRDSI